MPRPSIVPAGRPERELAPRPARKADTRRILVNVRRDVLEVTLVLDDAALEAPLEEVAHALVAAVEPHRVDTVQAPHPLRELGLGRVDEQVEVVVEEAPDHDLPAVTPLHPA
jgi:hypothetical protein